MANYNEEILAQEALTLINGVSSSTHITSGLSLARVVENRLREIGGVSGLDLKSGITELAVLEALEEALEQLLSAPPDGNEVIGLEE